MSRKYTVRYSPAAKDDLRGISSYILYTLQSPQAAKHLTTKIRSEIRALSAMAERYPLVDWEPWASMNMRKVPVGNFIVFYQINTETFTVTVTRIFYGGRDIPRIVREGWE